MTKTAVVGTTAAVTAAAGFITTFWAEAQLAEQGAWSDSGMSAGHLDFIVAAVLLVGATLVVLALILALALAIEAWLDGESRRDARAAERRALRRAARDSARSLALQTRPEAPSAAPAPPPVVARAPLAVPAPPPALGSVMAAAVRATRDAGTSAFVSVETGAKRFAAYLIPDDTGESATSTDASEPAQSRHPQPTRTAEHGLGPAGAASHASPADHESASGTAHRVAL